MSNSTICEFTYSIVNCEGSKEYNILYIISIALWSIICIFSFALLYWRLKYREDSRLFTGKLFTPLEGFLLWCGINNLTRVICCVVIFFNFLFEYPIIREIIFAFSWSPGFIGIYSFIAGMFQTMTRMKFEQFTTTTSTHRTFENVINESNHDESRSKTMWIPQGYQVTIAFWALTFLLFSLTTTSSIMMGLNRNLLHEENGSVMRRNKAFLYANGCLYGTFWFHCTFIIFILTFYGRNLLRMTEESFMLTGIQDAGSSNIPDRIKRRLEKANITFKAYINKIRLFNCGIFIIMLWFSACLIPLAVYYEKLLSALWIGLLYTAMSNFAPSICLFAILIAIVRAEMNPDQEAATAVAVIELNEINSFFSDVES